MATHNKELAIFSQEAPADTSPLWGERDQYGRVVFYIDMQDDPQRNISGTMGVDLYCKSGTSQVPEEIEPILRSLLDGYFFSNETSTIAARWRSTQYFSEPTKKVIGATLTFDLLDFPKQETIDPDPIALINDWTAKTYKNLTVIGRAELPPAWKPTAEAPAIYWRLGDVRKCDWIPDTYNCSWEIATIHGHVMAPDSATETKIARSIQNTLTLKKRLIFKDEAPLFIDRNIRVSSTSDALRNGQLSIDGTYGILNIPESPGAPIENIVMS